MTPLRLYRRTADLEYVPIYFHPYHETFRYLACNVRAAVYWMFKGSKLTDDYLRYGNEKRKENSIHRRLTLRWNLKTFLGR